LGRTELSSKELSRAEVMARVKAGNLRLGESSELLELSYRRQVRRGCGLSGYENLEAIHNPNHPQHEEYLEWIGDSFDPEAFDLDEINRSLRRLK
jgi:Plasmid pRiA4b ORF-3-like protein